MAENIEDEPFYKAVFTKWSEPATDHLARLTDAPEPRTKAEGVLLKAARFIALVRKQVPNIRDIEPLYEATNTALLRMGEAATPISILADPEEMKVLADRERGGKSFEIALRKTKSGATNKQNVQLKILTKLMGEMSDEVVKGLESETIEMEDDEFNEIEQALTDFRSAKNDLLYPKPKGGKRKKGGKGRGRKK